MKKGAILGSEFSGHTYIANNYFGFDDGIYTALRLIRIMEENKAGLRELTKDFPKVSNTPEIKVPIDDSKKDEVVDKVNKLVSNDPDIIKTITLDGIRAYISQTGWFLIRSSGTSPYLSIRLEGKDPAELALVQEKLDKILQSCT
jgi:phosphomannomutase/phosphoglucomutase